jgi:hypothetical protein
MVEFRKFLGLLDIVCRSIARHKIVWAGKNSGIKKPPPVSTGGG